MSKTSQFYASSVPLEGSNLVEASAGTGKTYSIAILVLRLLMEKEISIKEIGMVTFTNAAVAELEQRIRLFIRKAQKASFDVKIDDDNISALVRDSINEKGQHQIQQILNDAVLFLDETNVLTIHGFCQQTLNEFAFETNQMFGIELLQDISGILEEKINHFWRQQITTLPPELLVHLLEKNLSRKSISEIIKQFISGKKYFGYNKGGDYTIPAEEYLKTQKNINVNNDKLNELNNSLLKYVAENKPCLKSACEKNAHGKKNLLHLFDKPEELLEFINLKQSAKYVQNIFGEIMDKFAEINEIKNETGAMIQRIITQLNCLAIDLIVPGIESYMKSKSQVSFDDLISNLYKALVLKDNPSLVEALRKKYKAIFIDEFQDTDRMQFEIFKKAFGSDTILFYIGDPKQSIYAWRKADIFTYFKAYEDVKNIYEMNENHRSSTLMIDAMNHFFIPFENFDTFYFNDEKNQIKYIPVQSPAGNKKGHLEKADEAVIPITVSEHKKNEFIYKAIVAQVWDLLENDYAINKNEEKRKLTPSDIGILVKTNKQGKEVKHALSRYNIPAIIIADDKLFESAEAKFVLYLLTAMAEPNRNNINKALLSPFTNFKVDDILSVDNEKAIQLFNNYKVRWEKEGIYPALMDFINDFNVKENLFDKNAENGQRIITNLFQLTELLHKTQSAKKFSALELINWFSRGIQGMKTEGDEYIQRMESDEVAVKIVTIHKSKGLQYNIVLAPFLDFNDKINFDFVNYRDPESGEYITIEKTTLNEQQKELFDRQTEQEHRRLMYVAITRAVYKCFIFKNSFYKTSTLSTFYNPAIPAIPGLIETEIIPELPEVYKYKKAIKHDKEDKNREVNFNLLQKNWKRLSYTMLAAKNEHSLKDRTAKVLEEYDRFIFHELKGGIKTGLMLHEVFEKINFADSEKWKTVLEDVAKRYFPHQKEQWIPMLEKMLHHVLGSRILIDGKKFSLNEIEFDKRIHEFEFDFPVPVFNPGLLNVLNDGDLQVNVNHSGELEGIMNGKIDLFFECQEKYFVLDWKSNFLGAALDAYLPEKLKVAMNENNYHLQYLIYTLAVKKYLESRLPDFDYERDYGGAIYVFLRGVRTNADTGFFVYKPSVEMIERLEEMLSEKVLSLAALV